MSPLSSSEYDLVQEQIKILAEWNKENAEDEPEQVRRNVETIATILISQYQV